MSLKELSRKESSVLFCEDMGVTRFLYIIWLLKFIE